MSAPVSAPHAPPVAPGGLYVVATPIGNLGDFTGRAREVLAAVDTVLAEDTRVSATLLAQYGITTPMVALHEHNEARRSAWIIQRLEAGQALALISDAGTPALCDPGARLVRVVRAAGFPVVPVPGPSALAAALSVSGIEGPVLFLGFVPASGAARRAALEERAGCPDAIALYESPHRIRATLADLLQVFGEDRGLILAREITKRFETIVRLRLGEAGAWLDADPNHERGEFVLIVEPRADAGEQSRTVEADRVLALLLDELPLARAVRLAQRITGASRKRLYQQALALQRPGHPAGVTPGDGETGDTP
jgi:16S rRNA (cytidine1402-2'-O)-methyltransferase